SGQYRMIEICSTDMINLVNTDDRESIGNVSDITQLLEKLYWRSGATELATGKKTLTLKQFEEKYIENFKTLGEMHRDKNLRKLYSKYFPNSEEVKKRLR